MSTLRNPSWTRALIPVLLLGTSTLGCDSSTDPVIDEPFIGNWVVESFVVDGAEQVLPGGGFNLSIGLFEDGSYQIIVSGDPTGFFCDGAPGCNASGDYGHTGSTLVFDPGTADELRIQYAVVGDQLTLTGTAEGVPLTGVLRRL